MSTFGVPLHHQSVVVVVLYQRGRCVDCRWRISTDYGRDEQSKSTVVGHHKYPFVVYRFDRFLEKLWSAVDTFELLPIHQRWEAVQALLIVYMYMNKCSSNRQLIDFASKIMNSPIKSVKWWTHYLHKINTYDNSTKCFKMMQPAKYINCRNLSFLGNRWWRISIFSRMYIT